MKPGEHLCSHEWVNSLARLGYMKCLRCKQKRPMTRKEANEIIRMKGSDVLAHVYGSFPFSEGRVKGEDHATRRGDRAGDDQQKH